MKRKNICQWFFVLFAAMPMSQAQTVDPFPMNKDNTQAEYSAVIEVDGATSSELHQRADAWIRSFYPNPNGVIKKNEPGSLIEGTARFRLNGKDKKGNTMPSGGFVTYQIELQFKEGRYKYRFHRIRWEQTSYFDVSKWLDTADPDYNAAVYNYNIEQTKVYLDNVIKSLTAVMNQQPTVDPTDW